MKCKICNKEFESYRGLGNHLTKIHKISSLDYHIKYIGRPVCMLCGELTKFKNLNIGFKTFCSNTCSNRFKGKNPIISKKISDAQTGVPRNPHTPETKEKLSKISKTTWEEKREFILSRLGSKEVRSKISKSVSERTKQHYRYDPINGIRCESLSERLFIECCFNNGIEISRFNFNTSLSVPISNGHWRVPDFIINQKYVVEIKDFHPTFKRQLYEGLRDYLEIERWCKNNRLEYNLWFKDVGFKKIIDLEHIKNDDDLESFRETNNLLSSISFKTSLGQKNYAKWLREIGNFSLLRGCLA